MAILLGIGNFGLAEMLSQVNGKLADYASESAALAAPMPSLASNQKAVLVTVTTGGRTTTYQKTADGLTTWIQQ